MKLTDNYQLRIMAGEYVLMPQGSFLSEGKPPLVVNETMADIISKISACASIKDLTEYLNSEYGLNADTANEEAKNALQYLEENGII